mgnify:CR=1 FL=1
MKYKVFDVVELVNGNKATILDNSKSNIYKVEIVNARGIRQATKEIDETEIKKSIIIK